MKLNIQNANAETVGTVDINDDVFGGRVKTDLIWAAVVQENASERRGTHATKNRALGTGGGHEAGDRRRSPGRAGAGQAESGTSRGARGARGSGRAGLRSGARAGPSSGRSR